MEKERIEMTRGRFPWILIIVVILIMVLSVIYVTTDISEVRSCESSSDCIGYQVSTSNKYVCANENVEGSFRDKLSMFKYSQGEGMEERPEGCVCEKDMCSPED